MGKAFDPISIFAKKDGMMGRIMKLWKVCWVAAMVACLAGCEIVDIIGSLREEEQETEKNKDENRDEEHTVFEAVLMTGVSYPEDYDWRQDAQYGQVQCELMLMTEDSILLKRPVGDEYMTASDQDMHHIVGNCLYEDWSTGEQTTVRKNGEVVFTAQGREMMISMMEQGGSLYTLGTPRDKGGYILRKDGTIVSQSTEVLPATALMMDHGVICFTGVSRDEGGNTQWCRVENGKIIPVDHPSETARIVRLLRAAGRQYMALVSGGALFLAIDDQLYYIGMNIGASYTPGDFLYDGYRGECYMDGYKSSQDGSKEYLVWKEGVLSFSYPGDFQKTAWTVADGCLCIIGYDAEKQKWMIIREGIANELEQGLRPLGAAAMMLHKGVLHIALVDKNDDAVLWKDGIVKNMGFHGFIDHMAIGDVIR